MQVIKNNANVNLIRIPPPNDTDGNVQMIEFSSSSDSEEENPIGNAQHEPNGARRLGQ